MGARLVEQQLPCEQDPDMWFPEGKSKDALITAAIAARRCLDCPALAACAEHVATMRPRPTTGVWAGRDYDVDRKYVSLWR